MAIIKPDTQCNIHHLRVDAGMSVVTSTGDVTCGSAHYCINKLWAGEECWWPALQTITEEPPKIFVVVIRNYFYRYLITNFRLQTEHG